MGAPGRRVHLVDSLDDAQLEQMIGHSFGGQERSTEELGWQGV